MASAPSQVPVRYPSGMTTDQTWQALGNYGLRNPFFYHEWEDDFDSTIMNSSYTVTKTGNGTVAHTAGDGGLLLFTTNTSSPAGTDIASIQLAAASFSFTAGKKSFFLCRLQVSDATNAAFQCGIQQTTTTPFTITDGLVFNKASGAANNLILSSVVGSAATNLTIPTAAYTLANNTNIDVGFYVDRLQNVFAFVDSQLVGYIPQSGSGTGTPNKGPVGSFAPSLTTANLNVTLAIQSGTASSKTMTADFIMVAKER